MMMISLITSIKADLTIYESKCKLSYYYYYRIYRQQISDASSTQSSYVRVMLPFGFQFEH